MSQNNQRKHYHIHAPYQHPQQQQHQQQQQAQHHHHHLTSSSQQLHHQQQQQQQHQQWYSQQQHYQHGLHLRESRHMQHAQHHHAAAHHHQTQHQQPHHNHAISAPHMFTSGYVGMTASSSGGSVNNAGSGVAHSATATMGTTHNMPVSSSSSSSSVHHHYSATALAASSASNTASAATGGAGGSAAYAAGRNRMFDLEMLTPQQQQQHITASATHAHSMLPSGSTSGRSGFDAYSHSSLYAQQNQRHHTTPSSSHHHLAATHHSLHSHHSQHHPQSTAAAPPPPPLHHPHQQHPQTSSLHHHQQHPHHHQQQHYYHHTQQTSLHRPHTQVMGPMLQHIKSEPVEQITVTPSIQTEEVIIKSEPVDDSGYHKSAPQIENNSFHMEEKRKQHEFHQQQLLQQKQQEQQRVQQQQKLHEQRQQQLLQHQQQQQQQQQQIQIKEEPHDYPEHHRHEYQQSEHTHNEDISQQTQKRTNSENSTTIQPAVVEQKTEQQQQQQPEQQQQQQISLTNIKTEAKPLNFPRRKLQTERSSTLPICQRCKQVFLKRQNYTQHVALSSCNIVEYDFKCSVCPMSFMSNEELQTHEQLHRSHRYFCQKYCGKFYETIDECEQHEYGQHEYEMYKCNICCISVTQREQLFTHLHEHKYQPRFDCCICRLCFQSSLELHDHYMANEDFCGKFYDKEAFKKSITSLTTTPYFGKPESSNLEISHTFSLKDIPPANSHQLEPLHTKLNTSKSSMDPPTTPTTPLSSTFSLETHEFPLEPQVEVKTEIKVEPDFYPPMDQSDYSSYEQDYNTTDYNSGSNQSLAFLQDYQDNASSSTNSSFSFSNNNDAIQDEDAMCCVPKCGVSKYSSPSLQFFGFPRDEKYLAQWLHNLKMIYDPNVNYSAYRICSLHFPKRCIAKYSLSYWAVPTFNLGHDDVGNLYQNRESSGGFPAGEMAKCSMPGCPSQRGETNVKFHVFPRDLKTLIKWCQNSRLPVHSKDNRFFCSRHFEEKCFGKFRLKPWAIPTLNLGTVYGKIHDNPNIYQEEKKCFLPFCRRSRSYDCNLSLYRFPRDETLLRRWCYNLRLDPNMYRGKNHKICSSHFIKEALGLRKLNPGAVPTLNLGHNDRFNIYENELYTPPPPPPPPQPSTSSKAHKFERMFKQEMGGGTGSHIYDNVFMNSMAQKYSSSSSSNSGNNLDLGDVCLVPSCKRTRHSADITLHTVPKRPEQLKKWCHNLKMDLEKLHKSVRICSAHFEKYCIGGCMRPFAVPTLELGHDDPNIYRNPDVIKKLNIRETCCVQSCKRNRDRDHANLHRFPTHPELLQKWCENLQKPIPDGTKLFNDAVCEVHFEDRCLRNKRLEKWAIPTLNLGWDDAPHNLPSEEEINENWVKPFAPNNGDEQGECCVASCKRNPQIDDVKLYRPPEDAEQLVKWAHNLQVDVAELPNLKICNLHFEQHCIGKRLLNWAMPTLNLGAKVEHLFENPPPMPTVYKKKIKPERLLSNQEAIKWSPRCCLPHCRKMRSLDKVHLFRFPYNNRQTLAKWCHNLQLPLVGSSHRRICSSHFESSVLTKRCPMSLAVPTLDLNAPPGYKIYQNPARLKQIKPGAQRQCIIESCRKTKLDGVSLYRFPNNRSILYKWRHNIKNWPKGKLSSQLRICGEHFEPHSVGEKKLSPGAIPTLNLGHDSKDLYPNETRSFFDLEKCVVNGCDSRKEMEDIRLFRFPRDDEELLKKWCHNLQMNTNDCVGIKICSKHFEQDCLGPRQLYKWSIPTLKLGHKEDELVDIIPNPPPEQRTGEFLFKCCVPTCGKTRKYDDAQMNSFPKHLKLFRKWKHNLKLDFLNFKEREKYKICNDHFEAICVGKTRLNFGALPTLNLGHDEVDDLYQINPDRIRPNLFIKQKDVERLERKRILREENQEQYDCEDQEDQDNVDPLSLEPTDIKCCVVECTAPKSIMREPYDLPDTVEFKQLWLKEMAKQEQDEFPLENKICGLHFQIIFNKLKDKMQELSDNKEELKTDFNKLLYNYQKSNISLVVNSYQCRVAQCSSNLLNSSIRLFFFPYGKHLVNKWSHNTGIIPDEHRRYMNKVCALHFESYCITENQRLRSWAIPTLNLPSNEESKTLYKNPDLTKIDRRMLGPQILKCAVKSCTSAKSGEDDSIKLFNFPSDDKLLKKWCDNLKMSHHFTPLLKICSLHFEKLCFGSCRIRSWAIPTLNLGHGQTPEHLNKCTISKEVFDAPEQISEIQLKQVKIKRSLDSAKCFVASCRKSRLKHGVRFYSLPSNPKIKRKWLHNLQIKQLKSNHKMQNIKICNLHFHKRCMEGKQLKPWAVPTMHLGHSDNIFDNPRRFKNMPALRCALTHCKNHASLKGVRSFAFPRSLEFLQKWSKNLKLDLDKCKGKLCQEHFEKEVIGERKLKNGAVPTLNLGHEDQDIYNNSELKEKLGSKNIQQVKITSDFEVEYEQQSEEEDEEELWESEEEEEEEEEDQEDQIYYDDEEEEEDEDPEEEEEEEQQRPLDEDIISVSNSISDWSSIKFKELRVSITPLTPEDLMDLCSRSSYEREFGSLTPASSLRGRRSITPASSWKDIRSETPEQKSNAFDLNLKTSEEKQEQKSFSIFREPRSVTPDQRLENKTEENLKESPSKTCTLTKYLENNSKSGFPENNLKRESSELNNEDTKRERLDLTEDETSSTSLPNDDSKTNLRTDKALNSVAPICCLKHCGKEKTPEQHLTTYGFPKDPQLLQKWCDNLGLQPEECIGRVCIDHFELRVIGSRRLKLGAVPTLNLGPQRIAKHTNVEENTQKKSVTKECNDSNNMQEFDSNLKPPPPYKTPKPSKQSVFRLCCLKHCRRKKCLQQENPEKPQEKEKMELMFKFPKNPKILKKWFKNLRLPENLNLSNDLEICSRHFEVEVIKNNKLHPLAVPTLELSYANRKPIYKNNFKNKVEEPNLTIEEEKCFLKHCAKREKDDIFLISFPKNDLITLRKWCKNLKLNYELIACEDNIKICSDHFEPYVFYKTRHLRVGAIPTLNLGHSEAIIRNCRRLRLKRSNSFKLKEKCCVNQCQETNLKLFSFPHSSELRKIWCNNLQLEVRQVLNNHLKICAKHFPAESFIVGMDNLKLNAIPVLNLGLKTDQHVVRTSNAEEKKCLVENCQSTPSVDKVKLFGFPEKRDILKKWLFNLNLSPETFNKFDVICSKHFDKSCIKNGQLHENAIPTQFLELSEKSWFYNNSEELYELQKICCVKECQQTAEQAKHLYKFPKHKEDVEKWLYNLQLPLEETEVKDLRVCDRHFEQSCKISNKDLITQALPTLNLGHNDADIYGNHFIKCCLDSCSIEGFYYHKLPEDLMLQSFWFQELEMESSFNNSAYICSVHFVAFFERILEKYSVFLKESKEYVKLSLTYNELKVLPALQTYKCHINKCNSGYKLIWKLFKFPKDRNLFNKWLHNTGLQFDYTQRPQYRLCAQHFEERCLSEKKLHRWSLPTLNLPFNNSLYVNPPEALPPQHENLKHCCVSNCVNLKGPYYKFPIKQLDIKKWIHNLDLGSQQCTLNLRVCFKHFENYCFAKAKDDNIKPLKSWSVPTLKLKRKSDLFLNPPDKIDFYVCCLNTCKQMLNKSKDIYLFKFPLSNTLKQKWLHNLNFSPETYRDTMRLCSLHFEMDCFYKGLKNLRKHSVPTLCLNNPPQNLYTNPVRRAYLKCCVKVCKTPGQHLHNFPKQKILLRKWCHNLQLDKDIKWESLREWKICDEHFEKQCFNKLGCLRNMSVPTLKLGYRKKLFKNPDFKRKSISKRENENKSNNIFNETNDFEFAKDGIKLEQLEVGRNLETQREESVTEITNNKKRKLQNLKEFSVSIKQEITKMYNKTRVQSLRSRNSVNALQQQENEEILKKNSRNQNLGSQEHENTEKSLIENPKQQPETSLSITQSTTNNQQEILMENLPEESLSIIQKIDLSNDKNLKTPNSIRKSQDQDKQQEIHIENPQQSLSIQQDIALSQVENLKIKLLKALEGFKKLQELENSEKSQDTLSFQQNDNLNFQQNETLTKAKPKPIAKNLKLRNANAQTQKQLEKSENFDIEHSKEQEKEKQNNPEGDIKHKLQKALKDFKKLQELESSENSQDSLSWQQDQNLTKSKAKDLRPRNVKPQDQENLRSQPEESENQGVISMVEDSLDEDIALSEAVAKLKANTQIPLQSTRRSLKRASKNISQSKIPDKKTRNEAQNQAQHLDECIKLEKSKAKPNVSQIRTDNSESLLQTIKETPETEESTTFTIYKIEQENYDNPNFYQQEEHQIDYLQAKLKAEKKIKKQLRKNKLLVACCIKSCYNFNNPQSATPLYKMPLQAKLRDHWLENCKIDYEEYEPIEDLTELKVCILHFDSGCFRGNHRLLYGAVPTLRMDRTLKYKDSLYNYRALRCRLSFCQRSTQYDGVRHVKFPQDALKKKWCFKLRIKEANIMEKDWICDIHFRKKDLTAGYKPKKGVIPTLLLCKEAEYKQEEEAENIKICCVPKCGQNLKGRIFKFPYENHDLYFKWLHQLKLKNSDFIRTKAFVCSKHFTKYSFYPKNKHLRERAVPELYLGQKEDKKEEEEEKEEKEKENDNEKEEDLINNEDCDMEMENKCWQPLCKENSKENLYNWPNKGIWGTLWLEHIKYGGHTNKKEINDLITKTKIGNIKLCAKHFYILYKTHEIAILSSKNSKNVEGLKQYTIFIFQQLCSLPEFYTLKCAVKLCKTDHHLKVYKGLKLFPFPKNDLAKTWCHNIQMDYNSLLEKPLQKVCQLHFTSYCMFRRRLLHFAVPTLNLSIPPTEIIPIQRVKVSLLTAHCCIPTCVNAKGLNGEVITKLYKFPQDPKMLKKWLDIIKCVDFKKNSTRICGLHFDNNDIYKNLTLKASAIPCYNLQQPTEEVQKENDLNIFEIDENIQVKQELDNSEEWDEQEADANNVLDVGDNSKDLNVDENLIVVTKTSYNSETAVTEGNTLEICNLNENIQVKQELDITEEWGEQEQLEICKQEHTTFPKQSSNYDLTIEEHSGNYTQMELKQEILDTANEQPLESSQDSQQILSTNFIISDIKSQIFFCCVQKCPNNSKTPDIHMITEFPRDSEIFIKWCFNLKIDPRLYQENQYAICQKHFENICFNQENLIYPWAVPTLHLNLNENAFIHQNDIPDHMRPSNEQCVVYGCINPLKPFYKFPFKPDLSHKWFANLKLDFTDFRSQNYRICKIHFPSSAFELNNQNILKPEAVPSLLLGHNDKIMYLNPTEDMQQEQDIINQDNSRGSSQGSLVRIISPNDIEDHDSSYFEDFEEYYGQDD